MRTNRWAIACATIGGAIGCNLIIGVNDLQIGTLPITADATSPSGNDATSDSTLPVSDAASDSASDAPAPLTVITQCSSAIGGPHVVTTSAGPLYGNQFEFYNSGKHGEFYLVDSSSSANAINVYTIDTSPSYSMATPPKTLGTGLFPNFIGGVYSPVVGALLVLVQQALPPDAGSEQFEYGLWTILDSGDAPTYRSLSNAIFNANLGTLIANSDGSLVWIGVGVPLTNDAGAARAAYAWRVPQSGAAGSPQKVVDLQNADTQALGYADSTHVYVVISGDPSSAQPVTQYTVPNDGSQITNRVLSPNAVIPAVATSADDQTLGLFAAFDVSDPQNASVRCGQFPISQAPTFDPSQLPLVSGVSLSNVPFADNTFDGRFLTLTGSLQGDTTHIRTVTFDAKFGQLAISAQLAATQSGNQLTARPRAAFSSALGVFTSGAVWGEAPVVSDGGTPPNTYYFDQVVCANPPSGGGG